MKKSLTKKLQTWHGVVVGVLVLGLGLGFSITTGTSLAQSPLQSTAPCALPNCVPAPAPAASASGVVREIQSGAVNVASGVEVSTNPNAKPGSSNAQPLPTFSGVSAPLWVSTSGPAQVADDLVIYGLTDLKNGFINTAQAASSTAAAPIAPTLTPVTVYDNLYISGNTSTSEAGNLYLNGSINNLNGNINLIPAGGATKQTVIITGSQEVSGKLNVGDDTQLTSNLNVLGDTQVLGLTADNAAVKNTLKVDGLSTLKDAWMEGNAFVRGTINAGSLNSQGGIFASGNIKSFGSINAGTGASNNIGRFYRLTQSATYNTVGVKNLNITCPAPDTIVSCSGFFGGPNGDTIFYGAMMNANTCGVSGFLTSTNTRVLIGQSICFSPSGTVPGAPTGTTIVTLP